MTLLTGYHDIAFDTVKRKKAVNRIATQLPADVGIVCTGLSGILVGVALANKTKRPFAIVRKPGDNTHSSFTVEGYLFDQYVIVDDFIEYGGTIRRILREMYKHNDESECRGIMLYGEDSDRLPMKYKGKEITVYSCGEE